MSTNPLSLSAIAKVITRFLFGDTQIPSFLRHYGVFFTGITTGAVAAPTLYAYLTRNQHDRGKVQLAVFHIIRLFEVRGEYAGLLHDPEELLKRMEPEVLAMVKKHLTKAEAGEVVKELKREYAHLETAEHRRKRLRAAVKPPKVAYLMPAYAPRPRGFLPATSLADSFAFVANGVTSWKTFPVEGDDDDDDDVNLTTPGEATAVAAPTAKGLHKTAKAKQVEVVAVRHAPQHGSYGLDYDDFSSSSEDDDDDDDDDEDDDDEDLPVSMPGAYCSRSAPTPPTVVRMLYGHRCSGTSLSPIQGSPAGSEDFQGAGAPAPAAAAPTIATAGSALPFTSWTTSAELEYSSSTASSSATTTTRLASPAAPVPARASPATISQETARLQRKSNYSAPAASRPRSPPRRTTSLANTAATRSSASPPTTPFKRGRGRGRTGGVERLAARPVEPQELRAKKGKKSAKVGTPGTRKTSRRTAFQGAYGK